jgi:hypothetical protein
MPTNRFVESSFWNFDALFQPQDHPARDMHDTFFLKSPQSSDSLPQEYMERVKNIHSHGGYGSIGHGYEWEEVEAQKLLLRTHTTAVSSYMLYQLAQQVHFDYLTERLLIWLHVQFHLNIYFCKLKQKNVLTTLVLFYFCGQLEVIMFSQCKYFDMCVEGI